MFALGGHPAFETTDADGVTAFERAATVSAVYYPGEPRLAAFDSAQCNSCHKRLLAHGSNRNGNVEICLACHNGDAAVCSSNPDPLDGSCPDGETQEGYHMGYMVHSIHSASVQPTRVARSPGSPTRRASRTATPAIRQAVTTWLVRRPGQSAPTRDLTSGSGRTTLPRRRTRQPAASATPAAAATGHFESQGGQVDDLKCTIVGAECGDIDGIDWQRRTKRSGSLRGMSRYGCGIRDLDVPQPWRRIATTNRGARNGRSAFELRI